MFRRLLIGLYLILCTQLYADNNQTIRISHDLRLKALTENVWIHKSDVHIEPWGRVSANGMVIVTDRNLIIIDTPWNDNQTQMLVEWFQDKHKIENSHVIICHYHTDNLGGLNWINQNEIDSYSIERTQEICLKHNLPVPKITIDNTHRFDFQEIPIEVHFTGEGHTEDNISVYLPTQKILFGGCSVKSLSHKSLGNTADANLQEWPITIEIMKEKFTEAEIIIPGHGLEGDLSLFDHTLSLFHK